MANLPKSTSTRSLAMDDLTDYSGAVMEFKPTVRPEKRGKLMDSCIGTDPLPPCKNSGMETNRKCQAETQTELPTSVTAPVDELKLAKWLRKICPSVEAELRKGPTPLLDNASDHYMGSSSAQELKIQTYQKISMGAAEHSQGLATWLGVRTHNAPVLVVTTAPSPHDDWCEHVNQSLKLYVPQRVKTGNFVAFSEAKTVPLKACLKSLSTNAHNKHVFAGSTLDGDIYIWRYEHNSSGNQVEVQELFNTTSPQGYAVAMDWSAENRLVTCHANGWVVQWLIGQQMLKEWECLIKPTEGLCCELTALLCLSSTDFVVGTKEGGVYQCWQSSAMVATKKQVEITSLRKHLFMVSSLLRAYMDGHMLVISCDLSGQVYYHDIRNTDDDTSANVIVQIPLPFKNAIACSRDANVLYCPGVDGSLECYSIRDGVHSIIKGALRGKGNFIKCSDNGCWIITGLYEDDFQIFYVEN